MQLTFRCIFVVYNERAWSTVLEFADNRTVERTAGLCEVAGYLLPHSRNCPNQRFIDYWSFQEPLQGTPSSDMMLQNLWSYEYDREGHRNCSPTDRWRLKVLSLRNRWLTSRLVSSEFREYHHVAVHSSTNRRHFIKFSLRGCVVKKKPLVSLKTCRLRMQLAKPHLQWMTDQWKLVLFSNEKKFNRLGNDDRTFARRRSHENILAGKYASYCQGWRRICDDVGFIQRISRAGNNVPTIRSCHCTAVQRRSARGMFSNHIENFLLVFAKKTYSLLFQIGEILS